MRKGQSVRIQQSMSSLQELVEEHFVQEVKREKIVEELKELQNEILNTDKLIFEKVKKVKGKSIDIQEYNVRIDQTKEVKPGKTTFKYKDILQTVEENYQLDTSWLRKVYVKYSTRSLKQIIKHASLIITKL